ncbi:DUF3168 domain-containing protein [Streptomyces sp. NPDC093249]|uniref:DUF3168 domain-containing protein n=1 Tax=unclassified Streptomyces TaxID=2593676 RepID=UPI0038297CFF
MTTAATPMLPIQTAVYATLTADALFLAQASLYDYVPEAAVYPFVTIGEAIETPDNTVAGLGRQTVITLHVWTRARGHTPGLRIAARITELLDHRPLSVAGFRHIATRFEFSQTLTDPEPPGDIRHVVLRFRIVTEQT